MAVNLNGSDYSFWNKDEKNKNVSRSGFDESFKHIFTTNEGVIRPFFEEYMLPNTELRCGNKFVIWQSPLATRNFANQKVYTHYFAQSVKHMWHAYRQQQFGGRYQDYETPELHFNTVDLSIASDLPDIHDPKEFHLSVNESNAWSNFFRGAFFEYPIINGNFVYTPNSDTIDKYVLASTRSCYYLKGSLMDSFGFQTEVTLPESVCPNPWLNWLYLGSYKHFFMNKVLWRNGDNGDPSSGMRKQWFPDDEEDFSFKVGPGNKASGHVGRFWSTDYRSGLELCGVAKLSGDAYRKNVQFFFWDYYSGTQVTKTIQFTFGPLQGNFIYVDLHEVFEDPSVSVTANITDYITNHPEKRTRYYCDKFRKIIIEKLGLIDLFELRYRNYRNDYFTSGLPSPLIGGDSSKPKIIVDAQSLQGSIDFTDSFLPVDHASTVYAGYPTGLAVGKNSSAADPWQLYGGNTSTIGQFSDMVQRASSVSDPNPTERMLQALNRAKLTFQSLPEFGITLDNIRMLNATTLYLEALARSDGDYSSMVRAIYGVTPSENDTNPFYIGGSVTAVVTQDVVQTAPESSNADTILGSVTQRGSAGHSSGIGKVFTKDSMVVIGVMSIIPDTLYCQGVSRKWTARDKLDRPNPFFTGIQMQAIQNYEIFVSGDEEKDNEPLIYQGAFDFMRYRSNRVSGLVKPSYDANGVLQDKPFSQMTQVRYFKDTPAVTMDFVSTKHNISHEHLAVTDIYQTPEFVVAVANNVEGILPLPYYAIPQKV